MVVSDQAWKEGYRIVGPYMVKTGEDIQLSAMKSEYSVVQSAR